MENQKNIFTVDPANPNSLLEIMKKHGSNQFPFFGKNENGESVEIHVCSNSITLITYQKNGWLRRNIYTDSGDGNIISEELFDGRYKENKGKCKI